MERIICLVIGYVCGLFQTGYIIGKVHKTDIRDHGSGNAGTTNAFRTFGKKAGAITLLGDCLKCVLAIVIVRMVYGNSMNGILPLLTLYAALGCILGHNFPISMEFRGGKGIAASVGMIIAFDWRIFIVCAVVFFALFFTAHYVSLCSLSAYGWLLSWSWFLDIWENMGWIRRILLSFISLWRFLQQWRSTDTGQTL